MRPTTLFAMILVALSPILTATPASTAPSEAHKSTLVAAKEARLNQETAEHARMWRAPKHPGYRTATPSELQATGVVESGLAPLPASVYDIRNQWHGVENGQLVSAYAGSLRATRQAVVVMLTRSLDYHRVSTSDVRYVNGRGPVSIIGVVDGQLLLRDATGTRVTTAAPHARALLPAPR